MSKKIYPRLRRFGQEGTQHSTLPKSLVPASMGHLTQQPQRTDKERDPNTPENVTDINIADISAASGSICEIPLRKIRATNQIRQTFDRDSASFRLLVHSIEKNGVVVPVTVCLNKDGYDLIVGERRFRACRQLGLHTMPARVLDKILTKHEILVLQLIENLMREGLHPIDEAMACLTYIKETSGIDNVQEMINQLIYYATKDKRFDNRLVETIATLKKSTGKSLRTIQSRLGLLKLSPQDLDSIREKKIGLTKAYALADYKEHHKFRTGLKMAMQKETKASDLESFFEDSDPNNSNPNRTIKRIKKRLASYRNTLHEMQIAFDTKSKSISINEADQMITGLKNTLELIMSLKNRGAFQTSIEEHKS